MKWHVGDSNPYCRRKKLDFFNLLNLLCKEFNIQWPSVSDCSIIDVVLLPNWLQKLTNSTLSHLSQLRPMWCALQWIYSVYVYNRTHEKFLSFKQSKPNEWTMRRQKTVKWTLKEIDCGNVAFVVKIWKWVVWRNDLV